MSFPRKSILAPLLLALALVVGACASDEIGESTNSIDGRPFFDLFRGKDGEYYFNLAAANHEIVLSSEGYQQRSGALSGILSVLDNSGDSQNYVLSEARNGQFYFVLKAANGRTIGRSELYSSKSNAAAGITSVIDVSGDYLAFLATRRGARFTLFEGQNGLYYFNLKAANGQIVLSSQAYSSEAAAMNGCFAVAEAGTESKNYSVKSSKDHGAYFVLKGNNGEVIGTSESYYSASNARRARNSVIALLPNVNIL